MPVLRKLLLVLFFGAGFGAVSISAQQASAQTYSVEEIVQALLPGAPQATRDAYAGAAPAATPSKSIVVAFEGDSHRLTLGGMVTLRTLAAALQDARLTTARFQVVGHAYLPNRPDDSLPVSARRAMAVTEHLAAFYEMPPARFSAAGVGAARMANPGDPSAPVNQRIEIINIGGTL